MGFSNVCVFVLHGLLVTAFPTGDYDGVDLGLLGVPVKGIAEFSGTVPASGSCSIVGYSPCSDLLPVSSPIVTPSNIVLENNDAIIYDTENDEDLVPINTEYDEAESNGKIPNKVILGALIADAIMKEKGAEVDATLAELDAFVETEIANLGPLIQNALANTDTSEIDHCVDTALLEIESKIASELAMVDAFIEAELIRTEKLVESVTDNADQIGSFTTAQCLSETNITEMENVNMTEKETLVAIELAMLESFLESQLAKAEVIVESELEKVNSFVKSELAEVDGIIKSELAKVDLFVETELAKTDAVVQSELLKMESYFVDEELAKVDMSVEEPAGFSNVPLACGSATTDESCSYLPILPSSEINADDVTQSDSRVHISGTFPVSGRTLIVGSTGCPPIIPTHEPLPLHVESFPVIELETIHYDYDDSYGDIAEKVYDDEAKYEFEVPVVEEGVFSSEVPAEDSCKIFGVNPYTDAIKPQITILPPVNIRNMTPGDGKVAIIGGNLQFSGTARASGGTSLYAEFPCPPLTATEVGPNGKKYIWISKKPAKNVPLPRPAVPPRPRTDFPTYPADFPETVIMDSTKNYEKLMSEDLDVDFGLLRPVPVAGDAFFEGTVPAYGSVSITGHCA